jgi:hypothetical protein
MKVNHKLKADNGKIQNHTQIQEKRCKNISSPIVGMVKKKCFECYSHLTREQDFFHFFFFGNE